MMLRTIDVVCGSFLGLSAGFSLLGTALLRLHRRRPRPDPDEVRPVTILRAMAGPFPGIRPALETFFRQSHRHLQLVFGFRSGDDPARAVVEELCRQHPEVDCDLVVAGPDLGPNRKVSSLFY